MKNDHLKLLIEAYELWGKKSQVLIALEEMAELSKELLKNINRSKNNETEIKDEIADVYIMLEQLKLMYNISEDELIQLMENKLERLKTRLNK